MKNSEHQAFAPTKSESRPSVTQQGIDQAALPLLQKSSFFFFLIVSSCIVLKIVLITISPPRPLPQPYYSPEVVVLEGIFTVGLLIASVCPRYSWIGPILLLAFMPFHIPSHISSMYSMCAFLVALAELYRIGFFKRAGMFKISVLFAYYMLIILLVGVALSLSIIKIVMPVIFILLSFFYLLPIFQGKWQINIIRPRQKIRYSDLNLTKRETDFLKDCLEGANFKEIALRHGVSASTVRNTFTHIYRKLEVSDRTDLLSKFADFDIID
jgi:DNA-binding CsgD family transcriptional regulator